MLPVRLGRRLREKEQGERDDDGLVVVTFMFLFVQGSLYHPAILIAVVKPQSASVLINQVFAYVYASVHECVCNYQQQQQQQQCCYYY